MTQSKVTDGPSAGSVLPASASPWTEGWDCWTVWLSLWSCCRDSHRWVWDATCDIKPTKSELTWSDAQSRVGWYHCHPLAWRIPSLPRLSLTCLHFLFPHPTGFLAGAVDRHLHPWGHTELLVFHQLLEIRVQILYWAKWGTAPLTPTGFYLQQQRIWHFMQIWLPGFHKALVWVGLCTEASLMIIFWR